MRHANGHRKLNRTSSHRQAMLRNMATYLLKNEIIKTTLPKAKEIRSIVEKLITLGKKGDLEKGRSAPSMQFLQSKQQHIKASFFYSIIFFALR